MSARTGRRLALRRVRAAQHQLRLRAFARAGVSFRERLVSPVKRRTAHQARGELGAPLGLKQRQSWPLPRLSVKKPESARSKARCTRHPLALRAPNPCRLSLTARMERLV